MENVTSTPIFIDEFFELVKIHVECIVPVLHKTDVRIGPSPLACLLGDFKSSLALSFVFQ